MAVFNFKFALLVAFLVVIIGHGLVADAKPIEKKEVAEEKEATPAVAPAKEDEAEETGNDDADEDAEEDSTKEDVVNAGERSDVLATEEKEDKEDAGDEDAADEDADDLGSGEQAEEDDDDAEDAGDVEGSGALDAPANKKCCCHCCHHCCHHHSHHCHHCCHHCCGCHHCHHSHHCHHCCCGKKAIVGGIGAGIGGGLGNGVGHSSASLAGVGTVGVPVSVHGCPSNVHPAPVVHTNAVHTAPCAAPCARPCAQPCAAPVDHTPCSTTETIHHVPLKVAVSVGKPATVAHKTTHHGHGGHVSTAGTIGKKDDLPEAADSH